MDEKLMNQLNEVSIAIDLPLRAWNEAINAMNNPYTTPVLVFASLIQAIQQQAGPQVKKAKAMFQSLAEKKDEPQTAA